MQRYDHSTLFYSDNRKFASSKYAVVKQRDSASSASFACPRNQLGITRCDERCPAEQGDADLPILIVLDEHRRKASLNISMLKHSHVATRLPAQDLERARLFYAEKLSLEPVEERPGGLLYRCGRRDRRAQAPADQGMGVRGLLFPVVGCRDVAPVSRRRS
jgi:hypothetical protein